MAIYQSFLEYHKLTGLWATDLLTIPSWNTAGRPSGSNLQPNLLGINTDITSTPIIEWYDGSAWRQPSILETDPVFTASFVSGITSIAGGLSLTSGILSSSNFANTDLTFTGQRTHQLGSNYLTFNFGSDGSYSQWGPDYWEVLVNPTATIGQYYYDSYAWAQSTEVSFYSSLGDGTGAKIEWNLSYGSGTNRAYLKAGTIQWESSILQIITAPAAYSSGGYDVLVRNQITGNIETTTISGGSGLVTADNGLTANTSTNVQLGGPLIKNTTIDATSAYVLTVNGSASAPGYVFNVNNTGTGNAGFATVSGTGSAWYGSASIGRGIRGETNSGYGVTGNATSSGYGGYFTTNSGIAIYASSTSDRGLLLDTNPSTTNTIHEIAQFRRSTSGTATNGIGLSTSYWLENAAGTLIKAGYFTHKLTDATASSETSQFIITGVNNGITQDLIKIAGGGVITYTVDVNVASTITNTNLSITNSARVFINQATAIPTYVLPVVSGNMGVEFVFKNCGTVSMVINSNFGGNDIFTTSATNTVTLAVGETLIVVGTGTYWAKIN